MCGLDHRWNTSRWNVEVHHQIYTSPLEAATGSSRRAGYLCLSANSYVKRIVHVQPLRVQQELEK